MKLQMIVEAKDSKEGWFKAVPDFYKIDNLSDKIIPKIVFNDTVYKMLASVDNKDDKIQPIFDDSCLGGLRGVPVDPSDIYLKLVKQHGSNGKLHQFYYLKELMNIRGHGYLILKDEFGITYEELASDFLGFLEKLSVLAEERKICFYCIRLSFFFID